MQGVKSGLSGVCVLSGQVIMTDSSIQECAVGMEVQQDGHAFLERTAISFCTECALVCEGHAMLKRCQVFANLAAWPKGELCTAVGGIVVLASVKNTRCCRAAGPFLEHVRSTAIDG